MANNMEDVELDLLVKASEYVMKQDPVLKEYSRHSPGHFMRIIERMLEFHQQEANRRVNKVLDELAKESISCIDDAGFLTDTVPLSAIEAERKKMEKEG